MHASNVLGKQQQSAPYRLATQITDCVCLDMRKQLAVTATARQQQQCVCGPGWVQSRCVYIPPHSVTFDMLKNRCQPPPSLPFPSRTDCAESTDVKRRYKRSRLQDAHLQRSAIAHIAQKRDMPACGPFSAETRPLTIHSNFPPDAILLFVFDIEMDFVLVLNFCLI